MAKRICDSCGENKEVRDGKTCERGHFICLRCRGVGVFAPGKTHCPLCRTKLK